MGDNGTDHSIVEGREKASALMCARGRLADSACAPREFQTVIMDCPMDYREYKVNRLHRAHTGKPIPVI